MKAERDDTEPKAGPTPSEQAVSDSSEPTFPDGGMAAWLVVAGGCALRIIRASDPHHSQCNGHLLLLR